MRMEVPCIHWRDCGVDNGGCCAIEKYHQPSIGVCNICDENTAKARGFGDTMAKMIEKLTLGKLKPKRGGGCGCNKRRQYLNRLIPYRGD